MPGIVEYDQLSGERGVEEDCKSQRQYCTYCLVEREVVDVLDLRSQENPPGQFPRRVCEGFKELETIL